MRFNQYSYINFPKENVLSELKKCGFDLQNTANHKDSLETFLRRSFSLIKTPTTHFLS